MPRGRPKRFLATRLALVAAFALWFVAASPARSFTHVDAGQVDATALPVVQARSAAAFLDSIGVNTHMGYATTPYERDPALIVQRLRELGIRHIRDNFPSINDPVAIANLHQLQDAGIGLDFTAPEPTQNAAVDQSHINQWLAAIAREFSAGTEMLEGPNEYDETGASNWAAGVKAFQARLYASVKAQPVLNTVPVIAASAGGINNIPALSGITGLDIGNMHPYPGGEMPESPTLGTRLAAVRANVSGATGPVMATENGYHNAINTVDASSVHRPASPEAAGVYLPRMLLESFRLGVARTYVYQLANQGVLGTDGIRVDDPDLTHVAANYGLLNFDLSYKPAGRSVADLTTLLADDPGQTTPGSLAYAVTGAPADVRQVLLEKSDGSYYLALWRAASVWDTVNRVPIAVPTTPVSLDLDQQSDVTVFQPGSGTSAVSRSIGSSVPLDVGANTLLVRIVPSAVPAAPVSVTATPQDHAADVSWTQPTDGPPATSFRVTAEPGGASADVQAQAGRTDYSARVGGLVGGATYRFTVTASNAAGDGPPSDPSPDIVAGPPPGSPSQVLAEPGDGAATVSWTPDASDPPETTYAVTASPGGATAQLTPAAGDPTSAVVSGLQNGTSYTFTVTAATAAGRSEESLPSPPVVPGPPGAPTTVLGTPGDSTTDVSWTSPAGAPVTSYQVTSDPPGAEVEVPGSSTHATLTGLANGTAYSFTVTATNAIGSTASAPSDAVIPGPPSAPTGVTATPGDTTALISWTPAPGAPATSYRVVSTPARALYTLTGSNGTPAPTSLIARQLVNGTRYTFTVTAINPVGASAASTPSPAVVPGPPGVPSRPTAIAGDTTATVSWTAGAGGPATSYTVTSSPGGRTAVTTAPPGGLPPTTATVAGLTNGTAYTFRVTASGPVGTSAASAASAAVTPRPTPTGTTTVQDTSSATVFGGWTSVAKAAATAGRYRLSSSPGDTAAFSFTGTSVGWSTRTGPALGRADVLIDGRRITTVDLYGRSDAATVKTFSGLTNSAHTLTVKVLGTRNAASTGAGVPVDAFTAGGVTTDEASAKVILTGWRSVGNAAASGGTVRVNRTAGAGISLVFTGTGVDWLGATGPAYGRAEVFVDGVDRGTVDSYAAVQRWKVVAASMSGLPAGQHSILIRVLATKAVGASAADVPVDAFVVRP
jgi:hypothetical protein